MRDLLLERAPARDLDVVVEGDARPVAQALAERLGGKATIHDAFLTARVYAGDHAYDLATARRERYPRPGALPEVEPAPLDEDLLRRDFTVNAIAANLAGETRAAPDAREDLEAGRLRVLHDASFIDDPTRLLRLARYAARLNFGVDVRTMALARDAVAGGALDTVTGSRIGSELRLLLDEPAAGAALGLADQLGVLGALRPPLRWRPELAAQARALVDVPTVLLASAALEADADALRAAMDDWRFPAAERDRVVAAVRDAPALAEALQSARLPSEIADAVQRTSPEALALAGPLGDPDAARRWLQTNCATSRSRSTATTCGRPASRPARPSAAACARRWRPSSTARWPRATRSWPPPSRPHGPQGIRPAKCAGSGGWRAGRRSRPGPPTRRSTTGWRCPTAPRARARAPR